jgi:4-amino-4-deoxy-L-arabinose transferase-like glycosyltransferase
MTRPRESEFPARRRWFEPAIVAGLALAVRLAYVLQIRGTPLTDVLLIDSATYQRFARLILAGQFRGEEVYSMNPLYPYFVAGVQRFVGDSVMPVLLIQAVLGALAAALIFELGRRSFDRGTAWIAGVVAALYAPYVFYAGALLTPALIETLTLVSLVLLAAWRTSRRAGWLLGAGLSIGLAALGRGNGFLMVAFAPFFFRVECKSWRAALRPWAILAAPALLLAGLATARNVAVEGRMVPISANYAAFYLGHYPKATGLYAMPDFVESATSRARSPA